MAVQIHHEERYVNETFARRVDVRRWAPDTEARIIRFAVAAAMRQDESGPAVSSDVDIRTNMLTIRDRKDPRNKDGNTQRIPLLVATGYDAGAIIEERRAVRRNESPPHLPLQWTMSRNCVAAWLRRTRYQGPAFSMTFGPACRE